MLKQNQSLLEWVEKQSDRSNYMSKNTPIEILNCIGTVLETRNSNKLKNKYFSLMADESTNIKNVCEMTIIIHFVTDCGKIRELFLCIVELSDTNAETIA